MSMTQSEENELAHQIKELVQALNGKLGVAAKGGLKVEVQVRTAHTVGYPDREVVSARVWREVG